MVQKRDLEDIDLDLVENEANRTGRHWKDVLREKLVLLSATDDIEDSIRELRRKTSYFKSGAKITREELYDR